MKSKQKKFLGLLGLFGVAAITTVAILMPQPGVFAVGSATDTIKVTVERGTPKVNITEPSNHARLNRPDFTLGIHHERIGGGKIVIERIDGGSGRYEQEFEAEYGTRDDSYQFNLDELGEFAENFGYGKYKVTVTGKDGIVDKSYENSIDFTYNAIAPGGGETDPEGKPEFKTDPETGDPVVDPGVDSSNPHVDHTHVEIYPTGGEGEQPGEDVPPALPSHDIPKGETWSAPFLEHCLASGWYYFLLQAVDENGNPVGQPEEVWFEWTAPEHCVPVEEPLPTANTGSPNTGGLFKDLNVSREDALITGMVVFLALAALGTVFVVRKKSATPKRKRR